MKFTFETDDLDEAQSIIAALGGQLPSVAGPVYGTPVATAMFDAPPEPDVDDETKVLEPDADDETTVDVDARGLPWDARIHSSNGKKNTDGTWQKRRGVQTTLVDEVEAELRGQLPPPPVVSAVPVPPQPPVAKPPLGPMATVPQPPVPAAKTVAYPELLGLITGLLERHPDLPGEDIIAVLTETAGTPNIDEIAQKGGVVMAEVYEALEKFEANL